MSKNKYEKRSFLVEKLEKTHSCNFKFSFFQSIQQLLYSFVILSCFYLIVCCNTTCSDKGEDISLKSFKEGYEYQPSEYGEYEEEEDEDGTKLKKALKKEEEVLEKLDVGWFSDTFQLAFIQENTITILANISNNRAFRKKVSDDKYGTLVYVGPFRYAQKKELVYFTGDDEAKEVQENIQSLFFHHWTRIPENQIRSHLLDKDVLLCEINGTYYQVSKPSKKLARTDQKYSQRYRSYSNAKIQLMQALKNSLAIPVIDSNRGDGAELIKKPVRRRNY